MGDLSACMPLHCVFPVLVETRRVIGVIWGWCYNSELPYGCWGLNSDPLGGQPVFLITELSLQAYDY